MSRYTSASVEDAANAIEALAKEVDRTIGLNDGAASHRLLVALLRRLFAIADDLYDAVGDIEYLEFERDEDDGDDDAISAAAPKGQSDAHPS